MYLIKSNNMNTIKLQIKKLKIAAKAKGLEVRFHDHKTNSGDFCIFIYDKSISKSYIVGFDGLWDIVPFSLLSFDNCLSKAYKWINHRDNRFEKVDGKWIYKG